MADLNAALIAFAGVLAGGYANNFLGEDYKRFRDGRALAGALAGELESHAEALPMMKAGLTKMEEEFRNGRALSMPEWPVPASPLFDENAGKIGMLGPELARDVAHVYESLRAFRMNFHQLTKYHAVMPSAWNHATTLGCLATLSRAETRGLTLIANLKEHANSRYTSRAETKVQLQYGAWVGVAFLAILWLFTR